MQSQVTQWKWDDIGNYSTTATYPERTFEEEIRELLPPYAVYIYNPLCPTSLWNDPDRHQERLWWHYCYYCKWPMRLYGWHRKEEYVCVACQYVKCSTCQRTHEREFDNPEQTRLYCEQRSLGEETDTCYMCKDQVLSSLIIECQVTTSAHIASIITSYLLDLTDSSLFIDTLV